MTGTPSFPSSSTRVSAPLRRVVALCALALGIAGLSAGCGGGRKIVVPDGNHAPVLVRLADRFVEERDTVRIQVTASDPDGDSLTVSVAGATWITYDSATRMLVVLAPDVTAPTYVTVVVTATDTQGASVSDAFMLTVLPEGTAPPPMPPPSLDGTPPFGFLDAFGNVGSSSAAAYYADLGGLPWTRDSAGNAGGLHWSRAFTPGDTFAQAEMQTTLQIANGVTPLVNFDPVVPTACDGFAADTRHYPCWPDSYVQWVQAAVIRLPQVKYWQVSNEPMNPGQWADDTLNYARLVQLTAETVKPLCPDCKIVLGGTTPTYLEAVLDHLDNLAGGPGRARQAGLYDVADFHIFGLGDTMASRPGVVTYAKTATDGASIRSVLDAHAASDVPIWITEIATYSDQPLNYPFQSERQQARNLVKRMAYPVAYGVSVVLWSQLVDIPDFGGYNGDYFDHTGVIRSDQVTKKLAYWSMQKLTEKLSQVTWKSLQDVSTESNVVTLAAVDSLGRRGYLVWWDYIKETNPPPTRTIALQMTSDADSVLVTEMVPRGESGAAVNPATDFPTSRLATSQGKLAPVVLGHEPVFVEALPLAPRRAGPQTAGRR